MAWLKWKMTPQEMGGWLVGASYSRSLLDQFDPPEGISRLRDRAEMQCLIVFSIELAVTSTFGIDSNSALVLQHLETGFADRFYNDNGKHIASRLQERLHSYRFALKLSLTEDPSASNVPFDIGKTFAMLSGRDCTNVAHIGIGMTIFDSTMLFIREQLKKTKIVTHHWI